MLVKTVFPCISLCPHHFVWTSQKPTLLFSSGTASCTDAQHLHPPPVLFSYAIQPLPAWFPLEPAARLLDEASRRRNVKTGLPPPLYVTNLVLCQYFFPVLSDLTLSERASWTQAALRNISLCRTSRFSPFQGCVITLWKQDCEHTRFEQDLCVHRTNTKLLMDVSSSWQLWLSDTICLLCSIKTENCWEAGDCRTFSWNWVAQAAFDQCRRFYLFISGCWQPGRSFP